MLVGCGSGAPSPSATEMPSPVRSPVPTDVTPSAIPTPSLAAPSPPTTPAPTMAPGWVRSPPAPLALTEVAGAAHDDEVWVAGGLRADGTAVRAVLIFDPATGTWRRGPDLPAAVHHAILVSTGSSLYVLGGFRGAFLGSPTDAVYRLVDDASAWEAAPALPSPRGAGAAAWDGSRIVFAGGVGPGGHSAQVWALDEGGWSAIGVMTEPREHLAATSDGAGRTWLIGGRRGRLATNTGRIELVQGGEVRLLDATVTPRSGGAAFWYPALGACLAGGEGPAGTHDQVECVTEAGGLRVLPSVASPRHGPGAAVVGGSAWVMLGGERPGLYVSSLGERLDLGVGP